MNTIKFIKQAIESIRQTMGDVIKVIYDIFTSFEVIVSLLLIIFLSIIIGGLLLFGLLLLMANIFLGSIYFVVFLWSAIHIREKLKTKNK